MSLQIPIPYLLLATMIGAVLLLLFRARHAIRLARKRPFSRVEVTVIGDGLNARKVYVGSRKFEAEIADTTYNVEEKDLFQDPGRLRLMDRWRGIKHRYKIVFIHGQTEPVKDRPLDEWTAPPEILRIIQRSRSIGEAVRGLFAKAFNVKFLIPILIGVVVVIVVYFIYTGDLKI